ncbi:MAG: hypothetical protein GY927_12620, partial [bacterium]|nr:hypothetical protein [bacterium]
FLYNPPVETLLLQTKLYTPSLRPSLVPRPHLVAKLDAKRPLKLILLSAPAGYGKTTLITEWIDQIQGNTAVCWLSLDEDDSDPQQFFIYLAAAIRPLANAQSYLPQLLQSTQPLPAKNLMTAFVNDVVPVSTPFYLVLDDYHALESTDIDKAMAFLLDHMPPQMTLVITSRTDPGFPISRLRARGQLTELRADDLRFSEAEAAQFLKSSMNLTLSPDQIAALEDRTEGWIAGLQMAALSIQNRGDVARFIDSFTGSHRFVMDYLLEEVLNQQSDEVQAFLLQTAVLDRLCADLCDAVRQSPPPSQQILEQLEAHNLFLIPLDNERRWYRYHHLFAELLRQQLHQIEPDIVPRLHIRVAEWFAEAGYLDDAIYHALQAPDYDRATMFLSEHIENMVIRGDIRTALHHINQLPPTHRDTDLRLTLYHAWVLMFTGQFEECTHIMEQLSTLPNMLGWPMAAYEMILKGYLVIRHGRFPDNLHQGILLLEQAFDQLAQLSNPDTTTLIMQGATAVELAFSYTFENEIKKSAILAQEAVRLNLKAGNTLAALAAWGMSAQLSCAQGEWQRAASLLQDGLAQAQAWTDALPWPGTRLPAAAPLVLNMGLIHYQWNELDKATSLIEEADKLYALTGAIDRADGLLGLAQLRWVQGNGTAVAKIMKTLQQFAQQSPFAYIRQRLNAAVVEWQIRLVQMGSEWAYLRAEIHTWVQNCGLQGDDLLSYRSEPQYVALVRVWCFLDQAKAALALLHRLQAFAVETGRPGDAWRYQLLAVMARMQLGETAVSRRLLLETMIATEPEGLIRLYVDEGQPIATLLQQLSPTPYRNRLLAAFGSQSPTANHQSLLTDPLSKRELEILTLIASGLKSKEIAEQLIISLNTVLYHIKNIYSKLGVNKRTLAIAKAKELNLI